MKILFKDGQDDSPLNWTSSVSASSLEQNIRKSKTENFHLKNLNGSQKIPDIISEEEKEFKNPQYRNSNSLELSKESEPNFAL